MPHLAAIQASFGRHDVRGVRAHTGGRAASAASAIGALAYAMGSDVAFASAPDLHTAAHEAAHVVQQRAGVRLEGGVGQAGDTYERHADEVADAVVAGRSAEAILDRMAPGGCEPAAVQRKEADAPASGASAEAATMVPAAPAGSPATGTANIGVKHGVVAKIAVKESIPVWGAIKLDVKAELTATLQTDLGAVEVGGEQGVAVKKAAGSIFGVEVPVDSTVSVKGSFELAGKVGFLGVCSFSIGAKAELEQEYRRVPDRQSIEKGLIEAARLLGNQLFEMEFGVTRKKQRLKHVIGGCVGGMKALVDSGSASVSAAMQTGGDVRGAINGLHDGLVARIVELEAAVDELLADVASSEKVADFQRDKTWMNQLGQVVAAFGRVATHFKKEWAEVEGMPVFDLGTMESLGDDVKDRRTEARRILQGWSTCISGIKGGLDVYANETANVIDAAVTNDGGNFPDIATKVSGSLFAGLKVGDAGKTTAEGQVRATAVVTVDDGGFDKTDFQDAKTTTKTERSASLATKWKAGDGREREAKVSGRFGEDRRRVGLELKVPLPSGSEHEGLEGRLLEGVLAASSGDLEGVLRALTNRSWLRSLSDEGASGRPAQDSVVEADVGFTRTAGGGSPAWELASYTVTISAMRERNPLGGKGPLTIETGTFTETTVTGGQRARQQETEKPEGATRSDPPVPDGPSPAPTAATYGPRRAALVRKVLFDIGKHQHVGSSSVAAFLQDCVRYRAQHPEDLLQIQVTGHASRIHAKPNKDDTLAYMRAHTPLSESFLESLWANEAARRPMANWVLSQRRAAATRDEIVRQLEDPRFAALWGTLMEPYVIECDETGPLLDAQTFLQELSSLGLGDVVAVLQGKRMDDRSRDDQNATMTLWARSPEGAAVQRLAAPGAASAIGALAYAMGSDVAFASPELHTAAHEAAHVAPQRSGASLEDGVGRVGDAYEQHADEVADAVVSGRSAEPILDRMGR